MAKKDIKEILENAKRITVEASQAIVDTATVVVDKTQTAIPLEMVLRILMNIMKLKLLKKVNISNLKPSIVMLFRLIF